MNLFVTALNSGSNGNCYYIGNKDEAVLVDAGISCREIEKRMDRLGLSIKKVKALFISHEHADHIRGARVLSKKYQLPLYITPATLANAYFDPKHPFTVRLYPYQPVQAGSLKITAFPKMHDAKDPQSFIIQANETCVGVFTDIGEPCEHVIKNFKLCNAIFLEANYDDKMLETGPYPIYLKRRISGNKGHLSNLQALELFCQNKPEFMSHIFLSHISKENNDPKLAQDLFKNHCSNVEIVLTSRTSEIPVFEIGSNVKIKEEQIQLFPSGSIT
ncbi:MAG: MBL fold metallo-hydrolase [Cytophagaceae bacterium]